MADESLPSSRYGTRRAAWAFEPRALSPSDRDPAAANGPAAASGPLQLTTAPPGRATQTAPHTSNPSGRPSDTNPAARRVNSVNSLDDPATTCFEERIPIVSASST